MNTIQFARLEDGPNIRKFINDEWKENHILSRDERFFNYQHLRGTEINFVVSKDEHNSINAVLGFIPCSADPKPDVFMALWKVANNNGNPVLGIELLQFLKDSGCFNTMMSLGINEKTIGIYKYLGMYTDRMEQYVLLNSQLEEFKIAHVGESVNISQLPAEGINHIEIVNEGFTFKFENYKANIPYKDKKYFNWRYFNHPIFDYQVYGIFVEGEIRSIFVTRVQTEGDRHVLRVVDFLGEEDDLYQMASFLSKLILENQYEYADFLCAGFDDEIMLESGFLKIDDNNPDLIIPNYFSPFVQKNVVINYFADTDQTQRLRICKADGDQDRPN